MRGTCQGTYEYANEMCGGLPYYIKTTFDRFIMRAYDMIWQCSGQRPNPNCNCNYWSRSFNRDQVIGIWNGSSHANCLEW